MQFLKISVLCALIGSASAAALPPLRHTVHETRDISHSWTKRSRLRGDVIIPVRIALAQNNLARGHDALMSVSDPDSPKYGKHWSTKEIADFFAPSHDTVRKVFQWLEHSGIRTDKVRQSTNLGWIEFESPAEDVEALLKTEYHIYDHIENEYTQVGCSEYSIPEHLTMHVDFITPTVHFDGKPQGSGYDAPKKRSEPEVAKRDGLFHGPLTGPKTGKFNIEAVQGTSTCDAAITPECLRSLYNIPIGSTSLSTFGVVEYTPGTFLQSDLNQFWATLADVKIPAGTHAKFKGVDGGYLVPDTARTRTFAINGESDLDLEYAIGLVYPLEVTLFQVGDNGDYAGRISFDNFLDAIDKSYCSFRGGDNPFYDEPFPDRHGYMHKHQCGAYKAPAVLSTSYSYNEHDLTPAYEQRQCYEYMKLGLAGTSIFYNSGDYGVAGNVNTCINGTSGGYTNGSSGIFNPSFPSTCPYVTSVGATQIPAGATVDDPEEACETVIYSGGGFSNVFAMPSYQADAVAGFFANNAPPYTAAVYNDSQATRGFPDVAANGAYYMTVVDGVDQRVFGTSASTPVFASIVALLNERRFAAGKGPLGFVNPVFYKNPGMFNDITTGGNQGCGTAGFSAAAGWDPVTGLGTPDFDKMAQVLLNV